MGNSCLSLAHYFRHLDLWFLHQPRRHRPLRNTPSCCKDGSKKPLLHHSFNCCSPSNHRRGCQSCYPSSSDVAHPPNGNIETRQPGDGVALENNYGWTLRWREWSVKRRTYTGNYTSWENNVWLEGVFFFSHCANLVRRRDDSNCDSEVTLIHLASLQTTVFSTSDGLRKQQDSICLSLYLTIS